MKQAGFTLLEVLISITLLAFVMFGVISITENSMTTKDRVIREDKEFLQIETALSRLEWDLSHLWSPLYFSHPMKMNNLSEAGSANNVIDPNQQIYNQYFTQVQERFQDNLNFTGLSEDFHLIPRFTNRSKESFQFFTLANRRKMMNIKESNFAWVKYILETPSTKTAKGESDDPKSGTGKDLVRYFRATDPWSADDWDTTKAKPQVLMRNVDSMVFEFWNPERKKWETNLEVIGQGASLIRGVKIILEWTDSDGIDNKIERIFRPLFPNILPELVTNKPKPQKPGSPSKPGGDDGDDDKDDGSLDD